nr:hypothetical protein [Tanacetum cinerariifolium]
MDTTIEQQMEMDEALVPHAKRLRIGRRNFRLLSDISSKESTLQLVYDVLHLTPFFKDFLKTRSSSDTTITPPTAAVGPRLTTSEKGKPAAKVSKAKRIPDVPTDESEEEISWNSTNEEGDDDEGKDGDGDDEGNDGEEGDDDDDEQDDDDDARDNDDKEDEGDDVEDDQEEGGDDKQASNKEEFIRPSLSTDTEETRDEESFDPTPKTPEDTNDEGNGEENLGINV